MRYTTSKSFASQQVHSTGAVKNIAVNLLYYGLVSNPRHSNFNDCYVRLYYGLNTSVIETDLVGILAVGSNIQLCYLHYCRINIPTGQN